jgi:hypothetical protein
VFSNGRATSGIVSLSSVLQCPTISTLFSAVKMCSEEGFGMPQSLFAFTPAPFYFYTGLGWTVEKNLDGVAVSSKKYNIGCIAAMVCIIEAFLLCLCYYVNISLNEKIMMFDFAIPNDAKMITLGFAVTSLVLLGVALVALALYRFGFWIWENPRFVYNDISKKISFHRGKISYPPNSWQSMQIRFVSGFVHTPYLYLKCHSCEHLYVCVCDNSGKWCRHLIAAGGVVEGLTSKTKKATKITRLQKLVGCDVIYVRYSSSSVAPKRTIECQCEMKNDNRAVGK